MQGFERFEKLGQEQVRIYKGRRVEDTETAGVYELVLSNLLREMLFSGQSIPFEFQGYLIKFSLEGAVFTLINGVHYIQNHSLEGWELSFAFEDSTLIFRKKEIPS